MSNPVELHGVTRTYELGEAVEITALRGVDLAVKKGEFFAIMGPSGSGKTTLLNMIGGLDAPTSGQVVIDGIDITHMGEGELARFRRQKIGFIFQFFNLVPLLTALENVELPMVFAGRLSDKEITERAAELLRLVGLGERLYHRPTQMSGGEQQRVAIARALANQPSVVLADEPTGNIDQETGSRIIRFIQSLNETLEQTFIVVTHDPLIAQASQRMVYMMDGRIEPKPPQPALKPPPDVLAEERRRLLLAELGWLRTSLVRLEERRKELNPHKYDQAKMGYEKRVQKIRQIIQDRDARKRDET